MNNNLNNLQEEKNTSINTLTNQQTTTDVNLSYNKPTVEKDSDSARVQAMDNYLAGAPTIPDHLNIAETKPNIDDSYISKTFTARQEVMSKLNLMDEDYNYTDTYTNYVKQGGTPLPGYEWAHNEILKQEGYEHLYQQVEDGEMSYDTFLMEAYGQDILATMGYDVTSVAYWQNKFLNNDFSNPFANRYLMDQVKQAAEDYHQQRLASEWGDKSAKDTQLASLIGEDLEAKQIKSIFADNWSDQIKELDDTKLLQAIHTGTLNQSLRLTQDKDGTYYYLHTDGELYKCDGQNGEGHAKITLKADGTPESIDIGATHIKSFTSGFAGVFTGIAKLATNTVQFSAEAISMLWDGDFDIDSATSWATAIDDYLGDNANFLTDSGYVDFDEEFSWKDATHLGCSLLGTIAGTMALGYIAGAIGNAGNALTASENIITRAAGYGLKGVAQAQRWSTGAFGDYGLGQSALHVWGMRAGAAGMANFKGFMADVNKMNMQRALSDDPSKITDGQIISRALQINALNFGVDLLISGGMQDNQWQAYTGRNTVTKSATDNYKQFIDSLQDATSEQIINESVQSEALKKYITSSNWVIRFNSTADFIGNLATAGISKGANINKDGEFEKATLDTLKVWDASNLATTMQAAFNSYYYSYRSQKKDRGYNLAFNNLRAVNDTILNELDKKIASARKPEDIQNLSKVKENYLSDIKNSKASTIEGKILQAVEHLDSNITDDNKTVSTFVSKAFEKAVNPAKVDMYRKMYDVALESFYASASRARELGNPTQNNSKLINTLVSNILKGPQGLSKTITGEKAEINNVNKTLVAQKKLEGDLANKLEILKQYQTYATNLDKINKNITNEETRAGMDKNIKFQNGSEITDKKLLKKLSNYSNAQLANTYFITVANDAARDEDYKLVDAAMEIARKFNYVTLVDEASHTYAYEIQDGEDFLKASTKLQTITNGVLAMAQSPEAREETIKAMIENLDFSNEYEKESLSINIVDTLKTKGVLDTRQAISVLDELGVLNVKRNISKLSNTQVNKLESLYTKEKEILTALANSKPGETKINMGDPETQKALLELMNDNTINSDLKNELQRIVKDDRFFLSGDTQGFKSYLDFEIQNKFKIDKELSPDAFIDTMSNKDLKEGLELYVKALAPESNEKERTDFVNQLLVDMRKTYDNTTTVTMRDNFVILNLDAIRGKYTDALIKDVHQRAEASYKGYADPKKFDNHARVAQELDAKSNLIINSTGYSPVQYIDITSESDRNNFNNIMKALNYDIKLTGDLSRDKLTLSSTDIFGVSYHQGDRTVVKMPDANLQEIIETAFKTGHLDLGKKSIPLGNINYYDANGNKVVNKPDVVTAILSNVELCNLDPRLTLTLNKAPILGLLPYMPQEVYTKDTLATAILYGSQELGMKRGKMAGSSTGLAENTAMKTVASVVEQDKTLANFFAINQVVDYLSDNQDKLLRISDVDLKQLKDLGLVDTPDSFWESSNPKKSKEKYIFLKPEVTKEKLQEYILDKNFNMYKILPLIGYTETDAWGQDMTTQQTKVQATRKGQLPRETLLDVLNVDFPWDNNQQDFKKAFFKKFLDGSEEYTYNPIKGHKYKYSSSSIEAEDWDSYIKAVKNSKDPYDILVNRYLETFDKLSKAEEGTEPEMWRLVLKNKKITQKLVEADELTDELKQEIKDEYGNMQFVKDTHARYSNRRSTYTSNSYHQPAGTTLVGTDILSGLLDDFSNISYKYQEGGTLKNWIPSDLDIEQAFDEAKKIQVSITDDKYGSYQSFVSARFEQNPVMRILTTLGSSDGYVAIEDCDELADLIAENYREIMDKPLDTIMKEIKYRDGVQDLFKSIYKEDADKAIRSIVDKAKLLPKLEDEAYTSVRKITNPNSPSQELTRNYDISADGSNLKTAKESWETYLARQRSNEREDRWNRLADTVSNTVDYYTINKGARDRELQDRLFEQKFPANSLSQEFTKDYNSNGPQYVAINTMNKLKEILKTKDNDMNLMQTAITLTNLHYGNTQFTGSTTNYAVIGKDGSLLDMETWGRENLTDMLQPILNNKQALIGSTVVYTDNQDITDISALNLKTRTISNEDDYKDFLSDAYQSWAYDNMFYLKRALNTNDSLTVMQMLPQLKKEKLQEILDVAPRISISEKEESLSMWKSVEPYWAMDKADFYKVYKGALTGGNSFENKEATYNAISRALEKELDLDNAYDKTSGLERRAIDAITYGMSNDLFNDNQRQAIKAIKASILDGQDRILATHVKDYINGDETAKLKIQEILDNNPEMGKRNLALMYLANEDSTANTDFLTRNNRSLVGMNKIRHRKDSGSSLVISRDGDTIPTKDVQAALSSIRDNTENTSKYDTLVWYDTETTNIRANQGNMDSVFSVAFYIKKYENGQWNTYEIDAFLKHDEDPEVWFTHNINEKDAFYLENPAFKTYANKYKNGDGDFYTNDELREEISRYITPGKTLLLGHNADSSDLPWLKNNGVFNEEFLKNIKHIDTIMIAAHNLNDDRAKRTVSNQGLFEYFYGRQDNSAHGALADAKVTAQITDKLVSTQYNIDYLKSKELTNLENFMKDFGVELNQEDYKFIDSKIKQIKEDNKENLDYFKRNYTISTDKAAALSYAFSYSMQKDYPKLVYEAFNKDYNISNESKQAILSGDYNKINGILTWANNKGQLREAIKAIRKVAGSEGYITDDKIIKTISSDADVKAIQKALNIPEEELKDIDTSSIRGILSQDISKNSAISSEELNTYNDLKGTYNFAEAMKKVNDIIQSPSANRTVMQALLTAYDFSGDIENLDLWLNSQKPDFIRSKYDIQREEILNGAFGDVRALFSIPVAGKYSLITSFNVDDPYTDALTGKKIISDSSMAIVSKDYFESLMGESLDNYRNKGELYTNLLIHPADGNNKIHACRIIVDENAKGMSIRIPETIAETMLARDFDGDHTILIKPDQDSQAILKEYADHIYKAHDVQEKTLNWLKQQTLKGTKDLDIIYSKVGRNKDVIEVCRRADKMLKNGATEAEVNKVLLKDFDNAVEKALGDSTNIDIDEIKKSLWIKDFNTKEFENKERHIIYVNNPAVSTTNKMKSYSADAKQEIASLTEQQINKYLPIDSATGEIQKQFILNAKAQKLTYQDMISNDIYGSKVVDDYISRLSESQVQDFVDFTKQNVEQYRTQNTNATIDATLKAMQDAATKGNINTVAVCYDALLRTIEVDLKDNQSNNIMKIYGSDNTQKLWDRQRAMLEAKEKGVQLVNEYRNKTKYFYSAGNDPYTDAKFNYVLNDAVQETEFDNRIKYVDDFKDRETCKTFVVTGGWPAAVDEILTNNKSTNPFSVWRAERLTFNPSDKVQEFNGEKLKADDMLPSGFVITRDSKGDSKLVTNSESKVLYVNYKDKTIVLANKDELDGQVKIVTNEGSKGPVNNNFSIDSPDVTLIVNQDTMKRDKLVTSNGEPINFKEETRTITDNHGKKYTVTGYVINDVVPTLTEDAKSFKTKNGITSLLKQDDLYSIDHLHHCSDSKSVEGSTLMGGWYLYMKDGELYYDPSRVQNLISSLEHPERLAQAHNMIDGLQYMRMAYVLEQRSEDELQKIYKTNLSKEQIIRNKMNDVRVGSENYNAEINWFVNKYGINSDNELVKKLFSQGFNNLISGTIQTGSEGVTTNKPGGKSGIGSRSAVNEKGESTALYSRGKVDSPELYNANLDYDYNYDDYYVPALRAYKYLFGDIASSSQLFNWTRKGIMNRGRYYANANVSNGFKNTNEQYVQERNPMDTWAHHGIGTSAKSAALMNPYYYNILSNQGIEPAMTDKKYLINHTGSPNNMALLDSITQGKGITNDVMVAKVLHNLGSITPNMTSREKLNVLSDDKIFSISQMIPYYGINPETNELELRMTNPQDYSSDAKGIAKRINSSIHDFNYAYKVFNKKDFNVDNLYENIDPNKVTERVDKYKEKKQEVDKALDNIYKSLYNKMTGEVNDIPVEELYKDKNKARVAMPEVIKDKDKELIFKKDPLLMSGSGLKEDNPDTIALGRAYKKQNSYSTFVSQDSLNRLTALQEELTKSGMSEQEFEDFAKARSLIALSENPESSELFNLYKEKFGIKDWEAFKTNAINNGLRYQNMTVAYENYLNSINSLSREVQRLTGQPVADLITYMCPFKSTDTNIKKAQVIQTVKGMLNFDNRDPLKTTEGSIAFDFFNSSKAMIQELSKEYGIVAIKDTLLDKDLNFASNESLLNKTYNLLSNAIEEDDYKIFDGDEKKKETYLEDMKYVFDAIGEYTTINKKANQSISIREQYRDMWNELSGNTDILISKFNDDFDSNISTYSEFLTVANDLSSDAVLRERAQTVANYMWAKMICAQGIIESSPSFAQQFTEYINSLYKDGYSLVNAFGQKYERGQWMKPLTNTSMSNLKDNLGISYHSNNEAMWNQYLLEKIISGEVYVLRNDVVDYLDKNVYTRNNGSNVTQTLKNISKWSSAIQMAIPSKLLNRLISFTGFDYSMGISYDPNTLKYMGKARRDLLAAFQSNGKNMDPVLETYMKLEGQPIGLTGKDPVTFSEELNGPDKVMKILNTMTDPLEFQNHLGRYAIYLTALEGFENGDPNYGPLYYKKDAIDNSPLTNEEKAMYVMDYMLGSPNGGFPMLAKKTSGYMLYATFPMAFTRTLGAYGMSIGKLAQEGFTQDNARQWMRTVGNPGMGVLAITGLAALITSLVCDLYGVEEDEKEKLLKRHVTLDPIGTMIGGTPTASSSSMNPFSNLEEMFITPFKNETYKSTTDNPTFFDKIKGFANVNIFSHLNPAIKTPIELLSGKDIYAAAPIDTKYYYTGTENAARKLMGFFVGSSMANALVDQYKMDSYSKDSTFLDSLRTGVKRGIANSVGNQKTYKKDTTNYYNNIYKINNYKYANSVYSDAEAEDLMNANYLSSRRNASGKYGDYDQDDYKRISNVLRKMINNKAEPAEVYGVIVSEYNKGTSESTLRVVLNNCSIIRKLKQIDTTAYLRTLDPKERASLTAAIEYEERMYPDLVKFFPDEVSGSRTYLPSRKKQYGVTTRNMRAPYVPKTYPKTIYPNSSSYYTKYKSRGPSANLNRVSVKVSPQMGVWTKDYNKTKELNQWTDYDYNRTKPLSHGGGK